MAPCGLTAPWRGTAWGWKPSIHHGRQSRDCTMQQIGNICLTASGLAAPGRRRIHRDQVLDSVHVSGVLSQESLQHYAAAGFCVRKDRSSILLRGFVSGKSAAIYCCGVLCQGTPQQYTAAELRVRKLLPQACGGIGLGLEGQRLSRTYVLNQ